MTRSDSYPGSLDRRESGSFRWQVGLDGERITEHWKPEDLEADRDSHNETLADVAARWARDRYEELREERALGRSGSMPFSRLLRRFEDDRFPSLAESSKHQYGISLDAFRTFFVEGRDDPAVDEIGPGDVKEFAYWRQGHSPDGSEVDEPLSGKTVRRSISVLSVVFSHAVPKHVESNPVKKLDKSKLPKVRGREAYILSDEEYEALLSELEDRPMAHTYALVVGETGMRTQSEATWLRWEDIKWEAREVEVVTQRDGHRTKTDESRTIPASDRLMRALREHARRFRFAQYDGEPSPWVFHHTRGHRKAEAGDRVKRFTTSLRDAADRAGIPDRWRPYDLRHMRLTRWGERGSAFLVKELAGHADISTTQQYVSADQGALRDLVDGVSGSVEEGPSEAASDE